MNRIWIECEDLNGSEEEILSAFIGVERCVYWVLSYGDVIQNIGIIQSDTGRWACRLAQKWVGYPASQQVF